MFMLDRWESLARSKITSGEMLSACQELTAEMLAYLLGCMGLETTTDETMFRISGRGLTFLVPLRGYVPKPQTKKPAASKTKKRSNELKSSPITKKIGVKKSKSPTSNRK